MPFSKMPLSKMILSKMTFNKSILSKMTFNKSILSKMPLIKFGLNLHPAANGLAYFHGTSIALMLLYCMFWWLLQQSLIFAGTIMSIPSRALVTPQILDLDENDFVG
jgi:hypothetical protein